MIALALHPPTPTPALAGATVLFGLVLSLAVITYTAYRVGWAKAMLHVLNALDDEQQRARDIADRYGWASTKALDAYWALPGRVAARTHRDWEPEE